jgi:tRNA threonylcarbamoyladenosine biosynthesis protein TsaE
VPPRELRLASYTPAATQKLAATLAGALRPGDVVSLTGELGAGKTCFVQGAAAALGVTERVTSPSFLLRREYPGRIPVVHLDIYRLSTLQEVVEIGYDEVLDAARVTFIEWGDAMSPLLPPDHLEVELHLGEMTIDADPGQGEERLIVIRAHGDDWARRLVALAVDLQPWLAPDDEQDR